MHDVIVVGAGPAGCYTAYLLAKEGYDVLLLEEHALPGEHVVCSGIIGREAFEQMPLPQEAVLNTLQTVRFFSPGLKEFRYRSDACLALTVCRQKFDVGLARMAEGAGARLLVNSRAEGVSVEADGVRLQVRTEGWLTGRKARLCVLATGYGSHLLSRAGFTEALPTVQGAQAEVAMTGLPETEIYLGCEVAPRGFAWAVPLGNGNARVGITAQAQAHLYLQKLLERPLLKRWLSASPFQIRSRPIPIGTRASCVRDRLVVVGEAAGQVKTTTNGGIYYGLLCARLAAETISEALDTDDLKQERLRVYDQRWRERLETELRMGLTLREFFGQLSDRQVDSLFGLACINGVVPLIQKKARFDWHGPLIQAIFRRGFFRTLLCTAIGLPVLPSVSDMD